MEKTPATMMKEFVNSQKFENTADVMASMKEVFADVLQQVMECELEQKLRCEKSERVSKNEAAAMSKNYRNGYSKKAVKTQLGEVNIRILATGMGNTNHKSLASMTAMQTVWRKRLSDCTRAV